VSGFVLFACAWCQRVRTEAGSWEPASAEDLNSAGVTHGICPECLERETIAATQGSLELVSTTR
jgi:hypothetical protein